MHSLADRYVEQIFLLRRDATTEQNNVPMGSTSEESDTPAVCVSSESFLEKRGRAGEFLTVPYMLILRLYLPAVAFLVGPFSHCLSETSIAVSSAQRLASFTIDAAQRLAGLTVSSVQRAGGLLSLFLVFASRSMGADY